MIIEKKYNLYLLALLFSYANIFAIKINGKELARIINPGQALSFKTNGNLVNIHIRDGHIEIRSVELTDPLIEDMIGKMKGVYASLKKDLEDRSEGIQSQVIDISDSEDISYGNYYITGTENILLNAGNEISLISTLLTSKEIIFACKNCELKNCYINTDVLKIESNSPESICQIIILKFKKNIDLPYSVEGHLDFEKNITIGGLWALGVEEIVMSFSPRAFEFNNNKRASLFEEQNNKY